MNASHACGPARKRMPGAMAASRSWGGRRACRARRFGRVATNSAPGRRRTTWVWVRRPGSGRPRVETAQPAILEVLETLVDPVTRGDPESPLRWTAKSTRKLAEELGAQGFALRPQKVGPLLHALGYSL